MGDSPDGSAGSGDGIDARADGFDRVTDVSDESDGANFVKINVGRVFDDGNREREGGEDDDEDEGNNDDGTPIC